MQGKLIYELTEEDFREHGVWYFPMDDDDWEIVRPCLEESDTTVLVRTVFAALMEPITLGMCTGVLPTTSVISNLTCFYPMGPP